MISVCKHVFEGNQADRIFAHRGLVLSAFCVACEPAQGFDEAPDDWPTITEERAELLGLPLTIEDKSDASVYGPVRTPAAIDCGTF
jgi:hypothetical protein